MLRAITCVASATLIYNVFLLLSASPRDTRAARNAQMTEDFADILSNLSPKEMDEFVATSSSPASMLRWPPAPGEIKLSVEEVRQALEHMPKNARRRRPRRSGLDSSVWP